MVARKKTHKTAYKSLAEGVQPTRGMAATARKGFKQPSVELKELLRLVNLAPDYDLPTPPEIPGDERVTTFMVDFISQLPAPLKADLLEHMHRQQTTHRLAAKKNHHYSQHAPSFAALDRYRKIYGVKNVLSAIVDGHFGMLRVPIWVTPSVNSARILDATPDYDPLNWILGVEVDYIRKCLICRKFFFAVRINQPGCCEAHSAAIYKRNQRANKKRVRAEHKKKRATPAPKR